MASAMRASRGGRTVALGLVGMTGTASAWQLNRYFEKVRLLDDYHNTVSGPATELPAAPPEPYKQLLWRSAERIQKVEIEGQFFNDVYCLVGPRSPTHSSLGEIVTESGFRVMVPFVLRDGRQVVVCKGQVDSETPKRADQMKQVLASWPDKCKLTAIIRQCEKSAGPGAESRDGVHHLRSDQRCIETVLGRFYERYGVPPSAQRPLPYYVEVIDHTEGGAIPLTRASRDFVFHEVTPSRHLGYMMFWTLSFAFGIHTLHSGAV
eukprot:TRINITY_DN72821_c0_g1_i1.p1 TRINITY_DN72821_c0_g1~~TRINITY_DN72821_c0_g1_i1.p1  ORF type:complete len:288 (+),score=95.36 TRINITY_DN72821_c0_g1_i1:74-865(+)